MTLKKRLRRVERNVRPLPGPPPGWLDEDGLVDYCLERARDEDFRGEPDFPQALREYREALARAREGDDPPFDPPPDFEPDMVDAQFLRVSHWRCSFRFPKLGAARAWLAEVIRRVDEGVPPVTLEEFAELAAWFTANEARLKLLGDSSGFLPLCKAGRENVGTLRWGVAQGPRKFEAGEVAQTLRLVREFFPSPGSAWEDGE